jgi:hypothetical protein
VLKVLGLVHLDVHPDVVGETTSKELGALQRGEVPRMRRPGLERLHVCGDVVAER